MEDRIHFINQFNPDSIIQDTGGYTGYLAFGFKDKELFIFDSIKYGNATYIFEDDWEEVSKLTKKEIIRNDLAVDRIYHDNNWEQQIESYLK